LKVRKLPSDTWYQVFAVVRKGKQYLEEDSMAQEEV